MPMLYAEDVQLISKNGKVYYLSVVKAERGEMCMSLSARMLGQVTAEEMNVLLKEEGFLDGKPGGYYPTEKGRRFVCEKGDDNGYGGYAFRGWNWLEWDMSIMDELHVTPERKEKLEKKHRNKGAGAVRKEKLSQKNVGKMSTVGIRNQLISSVIKIKKVVLLER